MKAVAVFPSSREIKVIDADVPGVEAPDAVKLRVLDVGICGTDREIASFEYGRPPEGCDHLIVGHESLGEVVEAGGEVSGFKKGDLAVLMVRRPCQVPACFACRAGRQDFCYTGQYCERGIKGRHGYMAEYAVDRAAYAIAVPGDLREVGVLTEPLTIAEKALEEVSKVQQRLPWGLPGSRGAGTYRHLAVVVGAGPVGLLGAMALSVRGFKVHVYSLDAADSPKADLVRSIGAEYTCSKDLAIAQFADRVGNIDLVYEATGAAQVSFDMLAHLGVNAVFVFTGVPGRKGPFQVPGNAIMRDMVLRNQILFGSVNAPRKAYEDAVGDLGTFMKKWPDAVRSLITSRSPVDDAPKLLTTRPGGIKSVVCMAGGSG